MENLNPDPLKISLRLLNYRWRTTSELSEKLVQKGFNQSEIDQTIAKLKEFGYVDDRRFAQSYIRDRSQFRPRSKKIIAQELKLKGVTKSDIESSFNVIEIDDLQLCLQAGKKKYGTYQKLPSEIADRRLMAYLGRRGFSYNVIKQTLAVLKQER